MAGPIYFAIGDVHGEAAKLRALHEAILDRIAFEKSPACIVHLGDYVDRGPNSRGAVERVMALERMFEGNDRVRVVSLKGNHEQMMIDAYDSPDEERNWWSQGGAAAADSYVSGPGIAGPDWRSLIPAAHMDWLRSLPSLHYDRERRLCFVHAGIDPATFPDCTDLIRLWTRADRFFDRSFWPDRKELKDLLVVHGHTPKSSEPEVFPHRINIDTGACFGGPLTAVMLKDGEAPVFLKVD